MKKILLSILLGLNLLAMPMQLASAQVDVLRKACEINPNSAACQGNTDQPTGGNALYGPNGLLTRAAGLIAIIVGMASVIMIIIGGFKYVMSSGDPSNVKSAKDTVLFAIVGILVAVMAQSIVVFVLRKL